MVGCTVHQTPHTKHHGGEDLLVTCAGQGAKGKSLLLRVKQANARPGGLAGGKTYRQIPMGQERPAYSSIAG